MNKFFCRVLPVLLLSMVAAACATTPSTSQPQTEWFEKVQGIAIDWDRPRHQMAGASVKSLRVDRANNKLIFVRDEGEEGGHVIRSSGNSLTFQAFQPVTARPRQYDCTLLEDRREIRCVGHFTGNTTSMTFVPRQ